LGDFSIEATREHRGWRHSLLRKYQALYRLRQEAPLSSVPPTLALRALAREFPGALREIDRMSMAEIQRRIQVLENAPEHAPVEASLLAVHLFHVHMRGLLFAKAWLRGRRVITDELRQSFRVAAAKHSEASTWADDLERIANPPQGRLVGLACAKVAEGLGVSVGVARALVFDDDKPF
jgi:hypothetical protein